MKILLDACIPQDFRHELSPHEVETARFAGLNQLSNGMLLDAIAGRYDILVTTDTNLQHQQNLSDRSFSVLVLRASSNRLQDLLPLVPALLGAVETVQPGCVQDIGPA